MLAPFKELNKPNEAVIQQTEKPRARGYESWLIECDYNPDLARMMAALIVHRGNRIAKECTRLPAAVAAIRFLATPGRKKRVIARKVAVLLAAWDETSVMDRVFDGTKLDVFEFVRVLKLVAGGNEAAYRRLVEIAASLVPHLSIPRGPKVSAASAAHEFFLAEIKGIDRAHAYSWSYVEGTFTDPVTEATRAEFDTPDFDPRPAYRRVKALQKRN